MVCDGTHHTLLRGRNPRHPKLGDQDGALLNEGTSVKPGLLTN